MLSFLIASPEVEGQIPFYSPRFLWKYVMLSIQRYPYKQEGMY